MTDSTSGSGKSSSESSSTKPKSSDTTKTSGDASKSKSADSGGKTEKSAKDSIGGASEVHYGFFSSVRTPEYRSGWDDIWGKSDGKPPRKTGAKKNSNAKPATVGLKIDDLPDDIRDGLVEAARRKMRKSRSSYDKLHASGQVDWTINVTLNGGPK
jgi:hypothetical protein